MVTLNFGQKIFFSVLSVAGLSVLLISLPLLFNSASHFMQIASDHARTDSVMLGEMVQPALVFEREDMAQGLLEILQQSPDVLAATIFSVDPADGSESLFAHYGDQTLLSDIQLNRTDRTQVERVGSYLIAVSPVRSSGATVGYVRLVVSLSYIETHFQETLIYVTVAVIVALFIAGYLAVASRRAILKPIQDLGQVTQLVAQTQDYGTRAKSDSEDEVGDLVVSFNAMLDTIEEFDRQRMQKEREILQLNQNLERIVDERTVELQNSMAVLRKTVEDLRETQGKLVEQEKMASLGSLVAGVAHEINTPIGVGITAASHLTQSLGELQQRFLDGSLTKRQFADSVAEMTETVQMISKNLERSAALVKSFKMVAVDQSSDDMRVFNVKEYIENVLMSLKPKLKRTRHEVIVNVAEDLTIFSSPGALSQIVTNLIMNSLLHGFDETEQGRIELKMQQTGDELVFDYMDNGKGIPAAIRDRIFDPFVTTARHKGGSGLGTHILYNLVTRVLGGTVTLEPERQPGVHFRLRFPVRSDVGPMDIPIAGAR